jgi:hypothetical protein
MRLAMVAVLICSISNAKVIAAETENSEQFVAKFNEPISMDDDIGNDKLLFERPTEGYYSCRWFRTKPLFSGEGEDLLASGYLGFNLFSNGTVQLRKADKSLEPEKFFWKHNPQSGRVVFVDGPLSIIFKWPIHVSNWWSTRWISRLVIKPFIHSDGGESWVACTNMTRIISIP